MAIPVAELIRYMNTLADPALAESFDNCGLQTGDANASAEKVLIALEVTREVAQYAVAQGFDFIIVHHPLILNPLKSVTAQDPTGEILLTLARGNVGVFTAHTNLDRSVGGTGDSLCALLGYEPLSLPEGAPCGRLVVLPEETEICALREEIARKLNTPVRLSGTPGRKIRRLCVATGSGASSLNWAKAQGAEAFLTGELKYHMAQECVQMGMCAMEAGHYETEYPAMVQVYEGLQKYIHGLQYTVRLELYPRSTSPYCM